MSYFGRFQAGSQIPLMILTMNDSQPSAPDAAPSWTLYEDSSGDVIATGKLYPDFDGGDLTTFRFPHLLNVEVTAGTFTYAVRYYVADELYLKTINVRVLPAGDARGSVTSLVSYPFAENLFLMHGTDAGAIYAGKNPSF